MKKIILSFVCLLLVGCSNVSKEEYEQLIEEKKALQVSYNSIKKELQDLQISYNDQAIKLEDLKEFESELKKKEDVKISGGFVATVRDVTPDNCVNDYTLRLVLLQWFQGDTFVLNIEEHVATKGELAKKLKNKTYYFEIEPVVVEKELYNMSVEDVKDLLNASITVNNWIKIKDFREIKDNEGGLNSWFINVEPVK